MTQVTRQRSAVVALVVTGLIHLAITRDGLEEQTYIGVLFALGGVTALTAAVWIWRSDDASAWSVAALVCAGMFAAFVVSHTIGLPSFHEKEWSPLGFVSLAAEAWVVLAAFVSPREPATRHRSGTRVATGIRD